jgi:hypothetical protein
MLGKVDNVKFCVAVKASKGRGGNSKSTSKTLFIQQLYNFYNWSDT